VLLLVSVALNLNEVKGDPDIPVVEVLTVILDVVTETSVGALGVPGTDPVVIEVPALVVLPYALNKVAVTVYSLPEVNPLMMSL
jgi:hypothetical protein